MREEKREKVNQFNTIEPCQAGHVAARNWLKTGACNTRADRALKWIPNNNHFNNQNYSNTQQPYSTEVLPTFANHVRARSELRDPNVHHELQADLVKHIWTKFGMFHD
ncbi:hypothetical protein MTR_7g089470 [Medicago truncatula]|uniref:Uncharacterized protein n=1 Tax=Medicago truncatula TaxID=3880 RepID=G7L5Y5_MEDTR|nr:hypothetical protein MTR_7g089470 [Medicago truncatula]